MGRYRATSISFADKFHDGDNFILVPLESLHAIDRMKHPAAMAVYIAALRLCTKHLAETVYVEKSEWLRVSQLGRNSFNRGLKYCRNKKLLVSSLLKTARSWDYACGNFRFGDLTLPCDGVKREVRFFTDEEMRSIIAAAPEPLKTILIIMAVLGLRIGEALALRICDVDFALRIISVRQSVDAATRTVNGVKSRTSSANLPMSAELEAQLRVHLSRHDGKSDLLLTNRRGRPFSANKLRERQLHPLLDQLGIPRGGFHSLRHGVASALLTDGVTPAVVQRQLRHSDARITLGIYGHVIGDQQRDAVENRSARIVQHQVN